MASRRATLEEIHELLGRYDDETLLQVGRLAALRYEKGKLPRYLWRVPDCIITHMLGQDGRGTLTHAMLLKEATDKNAPTLWRRRALDYLIDPQHVPIADVDIERGVTAMVSIFSSKDEPVAVRADALKNCAAILWRGYYWILCDAQGKQRRGDRKTLRPRVREGRLPEWKEHDGRVAKFIDIVLSMASNSDAPHGLIAECLNRIIKERGSKTPRLEKLRRFLQENASARGPGYEDFARVRVLERIEGLAPADGEAEDKNP